MYGIKFDAGAGLWHNYPSGNSRLYHGRPTSNNTTKLQRTAAASGCQPNRSHRLSASGDDLFEWRLCTICEPYRFLIRWHFNAERLSDQSTTALHFCRIILLYYSYETMRLPRYHSRYCGRSLLFWDAEAAGRTFTTQTRTLRDTSMRSYTEKDFFSNS